MHRAYYVPVSIKILSLLFFIVALIGFFESASLFVFSSTSLGFSNNLFDNNPVFYAFIMLFFSVFFFFISRGLWFGKLWSKFLSIFVCGLGTILSIVYFQKENIFSSLAILFVFLGILIFLIYSLHH